MTKLSNEISLPRVSVVIPTRNRPKLLSRAVRSALSQTYQNLEVIVIIDGLDRDTAQELSYIDDDRLVFFELPESVGGSQARNEGVKRSSGEWIAFLDDDDIWLPEKISKQIEIAREFHFDPHLVISAKIIAKTPTGSDIWPRRFPDKDESISEYLLMRRSLVKGDSQIQTSSIMISNFLISDLKFTKGLKKHQDLDLYLRLDNTKGVRFIFMDEPLSIWNIENVSASVSKVSDWEFSRDWALDREYLFKGRSLSGFIASQAALDLTKGASLKNKIEAVLIMARYKARPLDYVIFFNICILPTKFRRYISQIARGYLVKLVKRSVR